MENITFKDLDKWKKINKPRHFSFYDYIFHQMRNGKINSDIYFAFAELFWPTFVSFKDYIFVKENFDEKKIINLDKDSANVEFWSNLTIVDGYFDEDEEGGERAYTLSQILIETWKIKLQREYPNHEFLVVSLEDQTGDYGLSFYQKKYNDLKAEEMIGN